MTFSPFHCLPSSNCVSGQCDDGCLRLPSSPVRQTREWEVNSTLSIVNGLARDREKERERKRERKWRREISKSNKTNISARGTDKQQIFTNIQIDKKRWVACYCFTLAVQKKGFSPLSWGDEWTKRRLIYVVGETFWRVSNFFCFPVSNWKL